MPAVQLYIRDLVAVVDILHAVGCRISRQVGSVKGKKQAGTICHWASYTDLAKQHQQKNNNNKQWFEWKCGIEPESETVQSKQLSSL